MEEVKEAPVVALAGDGGGTSLDARFALFCKNDLSLDDSNVSEQAKKLFDELKVLLVANASGSGTGTPDEIERYWFAFIIYIVRKLNESSTPIKKGLTLCQVLRAAKLNVTDFYKELMQFLIKAGSIFSNLYGGDWEGRLKAKESQTNFVHMILLSK
ncbi:hypothetical protein M569_15164 [Genlisea aurea]|uniref:Retinoblastoma-associated protein N-terminal domain-containing protein n=1 Tax=Genlisea aurea TaxID=192259 RepID=S8C5C3_9LAMI|nr:hypothetical protein M569_15164 [Genlisea aurea]